MLETKENESVTHYIFTILIIPFDLTRIIIMTLY